MPSNDLTLTPIYGFVGKVGKEERVFREGENIRPDDPAVKLWPNLFIPARYLHDKPVEQATAAPGERRA
jgi:hypothetical protein